MPAARGRRHPGRLRSRPAMATPLRRSGPGIRVGTRAHGGHIEVRLRGGRDQTQRSRSHRGRDQRRSGPHRRRGLRRRAVVARRAGRWSASSCRSPAAATDPVHRGDRGAARRAADDDRLRVELLLSPRGSRPADGNVGCRTRHRASSVETTDDWIPDLMEVVRRRAPRIADAGIRGGWAGLYEMTPDHNAIIGEAGRRLASPLCHRLLRPRLPAGSGRGRDPSRHGPAAGPPSSTSRRSAPSASTPPRCVLSTTSSDVGRTRRS